jgi:hypothetical protein
MLLPLKLLCGLLGSWPNRSLLATRGLSVRGLVRVKPHHLVLKGKRTTPVRHEYLPQRTLPPQMKRGEAGRSAPVAAAEMPLDCGSCCQLRLLWDGLAIQIPFPLLSLKSSQLLLSNSSERVKKCLKPVFQHPRTGLAGKVVQDKFW